MFKYLGKNIFDVPNRAGTAEDSEDSTQASTLLDMKNDDKNDDNSVPQEAAVENEKKTAETPNIFQKEGLALSRAFRLFLSFEQPDGTSKTVQVLLEDLLKDHGDISVGIIVKEAVKILHRKGNFPEVQEKNIELKYKHLSGTSLSIEVERELCYALKDFADIGELTIVISTGSTGPKEPKEMLSSDGHLAAPLVPIVTPKRRATKIKASSPKKKAKKPPNAPNAATAIAAAPSPPAVLAATIAGGHLESEVASAPPVAVKSEDNQLSGTEAGSTGNSLPLMSGVASKIYNAVGEMHALGIPSPQRHHVALLAGYSNVKSAGFSKALCAVKQQGLIEYPSGSTVSLSSKGIASLPHTISKPKNNDEMKMRLLGVVRSPKAQEVYNYLVDGKIHNRADLALAVGYTNIKSAGFTKVLSKLGGLGIIHYPNSQSVQLTDIAFPYGRPN